MERKMALLFAAALLPILAMVSACGGGTTPTPTAAKPAATTVPAAAKPAATAPASTAATPSGAAQGSVAAGQAVFNQNCNGCHPGGDRGNGPALKGRNPSAETIRNQVRNGGGGMPAFSQSRISDQQLTDLVAYVQSLK
ncbi:MAG: c-type cytochrome [Chloroflexota bacterium]